MVGDDWVARGRVPPLFQWGLVFLVLGPPLAAVAFLAEGVILGDLAPWNRYVDWSILLASPVETVAAALRFAFIVTAAIFFVGAVPAVASGLLLGLLARLRSRIDGVVLLLAPVVGYLVPLTVYVAAAFLMGANPFIVDDEGLRWGQAAAFNLTLFANILSLPGAAAALLCTLIVRRQAPSEPKGRETSA